MCKAIQIIRFFCCSNKTNNFLNNVRDTHTVTVSIGCKAAEKYFNV